jgi:hypothetical protein
MTVCALIAGNLGTARNASAIDEAEAYLNKVEKKIFHVEAPAKE